MTATTTSTTTVQLRYFAAAAEAAGTGEETLVLPEGATGHTLRDTLRATHGPALDRVLRISSLLVDDVVRDDLDAPLRTSGGPTVRVDVLPPFAGG